MNSFLGRTWGTVGTLSLLSGIGMAAAMAAMSSEPTRPWSKCPLSNSAERAEDCPWAGLARDYAALIAQGLGFSEALEQVAPAITAQARTDQSDRAVRELWGRSINYDEGAKGIIVQPELIDALTGLAGVSARNDRIVHAGVEHTYGYLFSTLTTPYGYKRARWVRGEIERGLGLPEGLLGPTPQEGTLLSNATQFFGRIALGDDPRALRILEGQRDTVPVAILEAIAHLPRGVRLSERFKTPEATIEIRSDFLEFDEAPADPAANSHLIVYSIHDSRQSSAQLITAFPMNAGSVRGALNPAKLGTDQEIVSRYNAWIEGVTGKVFRGERELQL